MISEDYKYFRGAHYGHLSMDWTVYKLLNPPKKPETLMQQVKREILSRDQSEDRMPPGGLYLVVGVENPTGLPEGRYYYVQHPLGGRNTAYAKKASTATRWAVNQEAARAEYTPEYNDESVYYGD